MALEAMGSDRVSVTFSVRMGARMTSDRITQSANFRVFSRNVNSVTKS
jgi:hypothetical protein